MSMACSARGLVFWAFFKGGRTNLHVRFSTTAKEKGDVYERFVQQTMKMQGRAMYLWSECPDELLIKAGLCSREELDRKIRTSRRSTPDVNPLTDTGVDGVEPVSTTTVLHQMKNWAGRVGENDIGTFLAKLVRKHETPGVLWTPNGITRGLANTIRDMLTITSGDPRLVHMHLAMPAIRELVVKNGKTLVDADDRDAMHPLRPDQEVRVDALDQWFKHETVGVLKMPCGTGKTRV